MSIIVDRSEFWRAWINTVRDYETTQLGGIQGEYPEHSVMRRQKKELYGFDIGPDISNFITFDSEKDYHWFLMRWS